MREACVQRDRANQTCVGLCAALHRGAHVLQKSTQGAVSILHQIPVKRRGREKAYAKVSGHSHALPGQRRFANHPDFRRETHLSPSFAYAACGEL